MPFSLKAFKDQTNGFTHSGLQHRYGIGLSKAGQLAYYALRRSWHRLLSPRLSDAHDGDRPLFAVPQALEAAHVANCRMFPNRLAMIESLPKGGVWAEIGTWEGAFAERIVALCAPHEFHLFDLDFGRVREKGLIAESETVRFHQGSSSEQLAAFPDAYFDVIYIDGDHALIGVARDADVAVRKLKPGGTLVFNDYTVFSYLELFPYGTVPVVNSLCRDGGWEMTGFALHHKMFCDVMLRRRAAA